MPSCSKCATELLPDARFCGVCGQPVGAAQGKGVKPVKAPASAPTLGGESATGEPPEPAPRGKKARLQGGARPAARPADHLFSYLESASLSGTVLKGRFEIGDKLGEGGFGAVYRGRQLGTGREVAIKLLHPEMTRDDNVVARFRREGEVLCQLRDAHTITTYDFDQTEDGTLFIAMELLHGRSLHEVFKREAPLPWQRMIHIAAQLCTSLQEAHSLGIVHRDLKPENIYLEERAGDPDFVKVLDFGIAKVVRGEGDGAKQVQQLTATGQTLGTLEYMSPEQLMGKELDGRSDVYAVGVLCYEMMTGQLPFPDAVGPAAQIAAQLKRNPPRPSEVRPEMNIPPAVDELVLHCLGKRPPDRFADAAALRDACLKLLPAPSAGIQSAASSDPEPVDVAPVGGDVAAEAPTEAPPRTASAEPSGPPVLVMILVLVAAAIGAYFALDHFFY